MNWINILHLYQPPTQEPEILKLAAEQSYQPLVNLLQTNPNYKLTLNICGCLADMLAKNGYGQILTSLTELATKGQVELTGSAAYHAFLPLLPKEEIVYQILTNEKINKKYFGDVYQPRGFFLTELAFSQEVAKIIEELNYKWIVLDEISHSGLKNKFNLEKVYRIKDINLDIIFRNRKISNTYVPKTIYDLMQKNTLPQTLITATDGELYGHHYQDNKNYLVDIIKSQKINFLTASEFIKSHPDKEQVQPIASSWESSVKELSNNCPYHLWQHNKNKIHKYLWRLANLAIAEILKHQDDKNFKWSRQHLNRGLASCTFWWASEQDLKDKFGPITWNPDIIELGANELIRSIRSLESLNKKIKIKAEFIYFKIKKLVWIKHWKKYA
jgi:predicted glycosyl hydrolase (DUF1957 family)